MKKIQVRLEIDFDYSENVAEIKVVSEKRNRSVFTICAFKSVDNFAATAEVISDFCAKHNLEIERKALDVWRTYFEQIEGRENFVQMISSMIESFEKNEIFQSLRDERKAHLTKQLAKWLLKAENWEEIKDENYKFELNYNYCLANAIKISAELDKL